MGRRGYFETAQDERKPSMNLTGSAQAEDRAAIIRQAKRAASIYYGTECIGISLSNERAESSEINQLGGEGVATEIGYNADWEANIEHNMWQGARGPECRHCKWRG
jgi:hypothetical protein